MLGISTLTVQGLWTTELCAGVLPVTVQVSRRAEWANWQGFPILGS